MTDTDRMVVWLRETMDAAQRDAEAAHAVDPAPWSVDISEAGSPERPRPGLPNTSAGMIRDAHGDDLWECEGTETLCMTSASAKHAGRHDPAAVLRRIAADRRAFERHQPRETLAVVKPPNKVGRILVCDHDRQPWPCPDITDLAESWGWKGGQQ